MSDPTALPPAITRAFVLTWGVEFVAYTLDTTLWGMGILLVLQYFRKYANKDPSSIQLVVAILGTFSTIHVIFLAIMNYKDFVSLFGNMEAQNLILHEANVMLCSVFVVSFTAQMFYASRIWYLANRNWKLLAPVILLGVIQFAAGIAQTVLVAQVKFYSKLQVTTAPVSSTQAGASLACDVTITVILFITLRKSRTGIRRTDSALDKMTIYALNRGAMTSLWALLHLIFFVGMPGTFVFMLSVVPSCHLYIISVCSMLISRESLREEISNRSGVISSFAMSHLENPHFGDGESNNTGNLSGAVHVSTSVVKWVDDNIPGDRTDAMDDKITLDRDHEGIAV